MLARLLKLNAKIFLKKLNFSVDQHKCEQLLLQKVAAVTQVQNMEYMYVSMYSLYVYMKLRNSIVDY